MMTQLQFTMRILIASLILLLGFGSSAYAAEQGGYVGFSLGQAEDDILDESDTGYKFFGGFVTNDNVGFELAYVDLGSYVNDLLDQYGVAFEVVGYLPAGNRVDIFGKVGMFAWTVDVLGATDDGTDLTYGFGASMKLKDRLSLRAEWERFTDISGGDVDLLSAGIAYQF